MTRFLVALFACVVAMTATATISRIDKELCDRVKAAERANDQAAQKAAAAGKRRDAAQKALEKAQAAADKADADFAAADAALRESVDAVKEARKNASGANCARPPPPGRRTA